MLTLIYSTDLTLFDIGMTSRTTILNVRFEVFTAVIMKNGVF
jgi:hypothetical protein